jgi:hypothetical protein
MQKEKIEKEINQQIMQTKGKESSLSLQLLQAQRKKIDMDLSKS